MRLGNRTMTTALIVLLVAGLGLACDGASENATRSAVSRPPSPSATAASTATPTQRPGVTLPPESRVLHEVRADLNGDGLEERAVAFRQASGDGLAIDSWQVGLPAGQQVEDLQARPLDMGNPAKVLLFAVGDDHISHYLYIYAWDGTTFVVQVPHGGPLDGQTAFRSAHYRTHVEDGDSNGTEEIMVFREASNPDYLEVIIYEWEWEEGAFHHTNRFMVAPRRAPSSPTPKGN